MRKNNKVMGLVEALLLLVLVILLGSFIVSGFEIITAIFIMGLEAMWL